jgi:hypothetical protein
LDGILSNGQQINSPEFTGSHEPFFGNNYNKVDLPQNPYTISSVLLTRPEETNDSRHKLNEVGNKRNKTGSFTLHTSVKHSRSLKPIEKRKNIQYYHN